VTSSTDGWHRPAVRQSDIFAALQAPQQSSSFDPSLERERRRLDLAFQPDERFVISVHSINYMSHSAYVKSDINNSLHVGGTRLPTEVGDDDSNTISYRFRYIEAEPQIGADPYILHLSMPGLNAGFFIGSEGYELLFDIHVASTDGEHDDGTDALAFLDRNGL